MNNTLATLPYSYGGDASAKAKWNPMNPEAHRFGANYMANAVAIVVRKRDAKRPASMVIVSAGSIAGVTDRIGRWLELHHDQTGRRLGSYEVVGLVSYDENAQVKQAIGLTDVALNVACFK